MALEEKGMIHVANRTEWLMAVTEDGRRYLEMTGLVEDIPSPDPSPLRNEGNDQPALESDRAYFYEMPEYADVKTFLTAIMNLAQKANDEGLRANCERLLMLSPRSVQALMQHTGNPDAVAEYLNLRNQEIQALMNSFMARWIAFGQMVMSDAQRISPSQ
jgi:hypothetical protein